MPPGPPNQPSGHADWGLPPAPSTSGMPAARRAAILCWITGGLATLFGTCAVVGMLGLGLMPRNEIASAWREGGYTQEQIDAMLGLQPMAPAIGVGILLVFTLPGLLLVVLGFFIKRRSPAVTRTAQAVVTLHAIIMGLGLLLGLVGGVAQGDIASMLMALIVNGGLLALLVWAFLSLGRSLHEQPPQPFAAGPGAPGDHIEPWNRHLSDHV